MIRVTQKQLTQRLRERPSGYLDEIAPALLRVLPNHDYEFDDRHPAWLAAVEKYRPVPLGPPASPAPWPLWARCVAKLRDPADTGVGDTVARELGAAGAAFKITMKAWGAPCSCEKRQAEWNQLYPYPVLTPDP